MKEKYHYISDLWEDKLSQPQVSYRSDDLTEKKNPKTTRIFKKFKKKCLKIVNKEKDLFTLNFELYICYKSNPRFQRIIFTYL
ncbi:hypothetical protein Hanom_Chr10g00959021 [Helianthus anomalus]